uniref:Uncharacterized protein n=1 Tax=Rhizophora mucronata TaxID=61149 RepID=A0A2P2PDH4_RHIMU
MLELASYGGNCQYIVSRRQGGVHTIIWLTVFCCKHITGISFFHCLITFMVFFV